MNGLTHPFFFCLAASTLLVACGSAVQTRAPFNLYELPGATAPLDNDSYYTQPAGYQGCTTIGESPSCAGGG